jgi:competence protein ComEC
MATRQLQTPIAARWISIWRGAGDALEARLEADRERIGLWLPVAFGAGIAAWFALPAKAHWIGLLLLLAAGLCGGLLIGKAASDGLLSWGAA